MHASSAGATCGLVGGLAEEARTRAEQMRDQHNRETLLRIAKDYDMLARRAEERDRLHL